MIRTPTVLQMEASECGAAALGSILGFYGCYLPLEELRIACGVSRDGSKAINILKAARQYGLEAQGASSDLESLREIKTPFIVFWEFNHFIVVDAIKKNKVWINDPATGPRTISWEAMNKGFTGVFLAFEPTEKLQKSSPEALMSQITKEQVLVNLQPMTLVFLVGLFLVIPGVVIPGFNKIFIDNILIQGMTHWFYPLIVGLVVAMVLQALLVFVQQRVLLQLKVKMILSTGANLIWHVLHLPMQFFYQRYAGDVGDRVNANNRIANLLSNELLASIVGLFNMVFFVTLLFFIQYQLAGIALLSVLLNLVVLSFIMRRIEDKTRDFLQQYGRLTGMEMSSLQMIETIKATGLEDSFFRRWSSRHAYIIGLQQSIAMYNQLLLLLPQLIFGLSNTAILAEGALLIMQGQLTVGGLVAFQSLLMQFYTPLSALLSLGNNIQQIRGDVLRINDVLQYAPDKIVEAREEGHGRDLLGAGSNPGIAVRVEKVSFGYSRLDPPLITNFTLEVLPQHNLAIIGRTGSGKSTLARLLMNLYKPWEGSILLEGKEIGNIPTAELANSIAMVEQDIFLFEGSIRDNLSLWEGEIPDQQLIEVLKIAELYEELLPRGLLDCQLLEGGINLSGGQRQRLEIARSLVKKPKLLVLDEATSSLDPSVEKKIFANLRQLGLTLIIITHRINAIRGCDQIIVMDSGKIVHKGRHEALLAIDIYQQLLQLDGY